MKALKYAWGLPVGAAIFWVGSLVGSQENEQRQVPRTLEDVFRQELAEEDAKRTTPAWRLSVDTRLDHIRELRDDLSKLNQTFVEFGENILAGNEERAKVDEWDRKWMQWAEKQIKNHNELWRVSLQQDAATQKWRQWAQDNFAVLDRNQKKLFTQAAAIRDEVLRLGYRY